MSNSKQLSAKKSPVSPYQSKEIAALQSRLTHSLNAAFDPKENIKSDDHFLEKDYTNEDFSPETKDINSEYQNPYLALAQKAKAYVRQKETEAPKKAQIISTKSPNTSAKKGDTFGLTGIGLEKVEPVVPQKKESEEEEVEPDDLPELDYKDVLQGASGSGQFDDLEELRKMIKQTRKEMKDYGRELFDLKHIIDEVNDYAGKELGYSANYDHMRTLEHTIQDLGQNQEFKFMKKSGSSVKNLKGPLPTGTKSPGLKDSSAGKSYMKSNTAETIPSRSIRAQGSPPVKSFGLGKK